MVDKWPTFIWKLFSNEKLIEEKGTKVWCYVPGAWRVWWIDAVRRRGIFLGVTLTYPSSIFKDVTSNCKEYVEFEQ
jgi:hypothetical protein